MELQVTGTSGAFDYVLGLFYYEEEGHNFQNDTASTAARRLPRARAPNPGAGDFFLHQKYDSQAIYGNVGFHLTDALPDRGRRPADGG